MSSEAATLRPEQTTMFDLNGQQVYADFYDAKTPVFLPNNPLHFKAHKLQILVANMEKQSLSNPAQFNSKNYLEAVDALMKCYEQIKEAADEVSESERLAAARDEGPAGTLGPGVAPGVGLGVSADNPLAG